MLEEIKRFALIGSDLSCSLSKKVHEALFWQSKIKASYEIFEIKESKFESKIFELLQFDGFNVTRPYKQKIIPYLAGVAEDIELLGCVNLVKKSDGLLRGYNTDVCGFVSALRAANVLLPASFCIIGTGATARAIAVELANSGASEITMLTRDKNSKAVEQIKKAVRISNPEVKLEFLGADEFCGGAQMLINATPVGTFLQDESPVEEKALDGVSFVFDVIYGPKETKLLEMASQKGISNCNGLGMLVWQAVFSHRIWYGARFEQNDIARLIEKLQQYGSA